MKMKESILRDRSYKFSIGIVGLYKQLIQQKEYVLSKQLLRSGTSIGALIREAEFGQSRADFINKMNVALKEANESLYWLDLLNQTGYIDNNTYNTFYQSCYEVLKMLISTIKTCRGNASP